MNHYLMGHKGDDSHTPTEDADSLCSRAYARIVDLLCEGEIAGLVNGAQSIYLNNIPLVDDNGNANFSSVSWDFRSGTQGQAVLNITAGVEDTTQIGTQLRCNEGVIAAVGDINVNSVLLTLSVGSMIKEDTGNGDIHGTSVTINIDVQSAGTAWQPAGIPSVTISGKTESSYQRDVAFNLPGDGPWNIRVTRITEDSNSAALQNSTYWTALTTVISDKFSYPNSAVIGFSCDASEFSSIPTRAYDLYGKIIQIPANYDPQARSYNGIWDGSFVWAWSDNPAWIMYDLITQPRYGLGDLVDATLVDKWSLYSIAQYCDEGVDDGFGGQEPRFTCNAYIQSQQDAIKTLNDISSNFRAMVFWGSGGVTVSQDSPKPVKYLFTSANVTSSGFSYQGSNRNTRSNTALVVWNDMGNMAQTANEYVSDDDDIAATGALRQVSLQAIGCTSRGQAHRLGKWAIYSALTETDTVIFSTGLEGMIPAPGDIIQTADPFKAGNRFGGRLAAASTAELLVLDQNVDYAEGSEIAIILDDGTVENQPVLSVEGANVTPDAPFSRLPASGAVWVYATPSLMPMLWRVISVAEQTEGSWQITALSYNASKYAFIEDGSPLVVPDTSNMDLIPDVVGNLVFAESFYLTNPSTVKCKITVSWTVLSSPYVRGYITQWQAPNEANWISNPESTLPTFDILDTLPGVYTVNVFAVSVLGVLGEVTTQQFTAQAGTKAPDPISGLSLNSLNNVGSMSWDTVNDISVTHGGMIQFRYCADLTNLSWQNGVDIGNAIPGNATSAQLPLLSGVYMAKTLSCYGVEATDYDAVETNAANITSLNVVETFVGAPWNGSLEGVAVNNYGNLTLQQNGEGSAVTVLSGTWVSNTVVDLGNVFTSRLTACIGVKGQSLADDIDTWPDVDSRIDWDGDVADTHVTFYVRTTQTDPAKENWSDWQAFFVGDWKARAFQFGMQMTTGSTIHTPELYQFDVTIDMPDVTESGYDITVPEGGMHITFPAPFNAPPAVSITAQGLVPGEIFQLTNRDRFGFDVQLLNGEGVSFAGEVDWIAKGYGKQEA